MKTQMKSVNITAAQLRRAADIKDSMTSLQAELDSIFNVEAVHTVPVLAGASKLDDATCQGRHTDASKARLSRIMRKRWRKAREAGRNAL